MSGDLVVLGAGWNDEQRLSGGWFGYCGVQCYIEPHRDCVTDDERIERQVVAHHAQHTVPGPPQFTLKAHSRGLGLGGVEICYVEWQKNVYGSIYILQGVQSVAGLGGRMPAHHLWNIHAVLGG
jgi:hypothetical protein